MSDRPETTGQREQNINSGIGHEFSLILRAWREIWFDKPKALNYLERYLCCAAGSFTYFLLMAFEPIHYSGFGVIGTASRPGRWRPGNPCR